MSGTYKGKPTTRNVTISDAGTTSTSVTFKDHHRPVGLFIPASFEPTSIAFEVSPNGTDFYDMYKTDGTEYTVTVASSRFIPLPPQDFIGVQELRIVAGSAVTGDATIIIWCEP